LQSKLAATWKPAQFPKEFRHLGDHIRAKRLGVGLQIKQLASLLGVDEGSVASWETGLRKPSLARLPLVFGFLGGDPRPTSNSVGVRLKQWREARGVTTTP
jgi:hypothetical protein